MFGGLLNDPTGSMSSVADFLSPLSPLARTLLQFDVYQRGHSGVLSAPSLPAYSSTGLV